MLTAYYIWCGGKGFASLNTVGLSSHIRHEKFDTGGEFPGLGAATSAPSVTILCLDGKRFAVAPMEEPDHVATSPGGCTCSRRNAPRRPGRLSPRQRVYAYARCAREHLQG